MNSCHLAVTCRDHLFAFASYISWSLSYSTSGMIDLPCTSMPVLSLFFFSPYLLRPAFSPPHCLHRRSRLCPYRWTTWIHQGIYLFALYACERNTHSWYRIRGHETAGHRRQRGCCWLGNRCWSCREALPQEEGRICWGGLYQCDRRAYGALLYFLTLWVTRLIWRSSGSRTNCDWLSSQSSTLSKADTPLRTITIPDIILPCHNVFKKSTVPREWINESLQRTNLSCRPQLGKRKSHSCNICLLCSSLNYCAERK